MNLNCKPGDLAVVVRNMISGRHHALGQLLLGRIVQCHTLEWQGQHPIWTIDPIVVMYQDRGVVVAGLGDRMLKPIEGDHPESADSLYSLVPLEGEHVKGTPVIEPVKETA